MDAVSWKRGTLEGWRAGESVQGMMWKVPVPRRGSSHPSPTNHNYRLPVVIRPKHTLIDRVDGWPQSRHTPVTRAAPDQRRISC
ncbi:hypothetical protein J6590_074558, partial [Homalodisca vitripennis]